MFFPEHEHWDRARLAWNLAFDQRSDSLPSSGPRTASTTQPRSRHRHRHRGGGGTEVAKNAGSMILSDDNFATILYAVEQPRSCVDSLRGWSPGDLGGA
jgi:hypothetical protein